MSVEQGIVVEQQPRTSNFDKKIIALFSNKDDYYPDSDRPSAIKYVETVLSSKDRFTDSWWKGLYKWFDQNDFHREKYSVARITFESLDTLPPDIKLPEAIEYWISNINGWEETEPERKQILNALRNPSIPLSLRTQLGKYLAESRITPYSVDPIMQAYEILGEDIGKEVREQILPLFIAGLAYDQFEPYREDLIKLYEEAAAKETNPKKQSFLSRVNNYFKSKTYKEQLSEAESMDKRRLAEKRLEIIRDFVLELFPPIPEDQDQYLDKSKWERLKPYTSVYPNPCKTVGSDMLTLPIETLERYLAELRQLKVLPIFTNLSRRFFSDRGIVPPYVALGQSFSDWNNEKRIPITSLLHHLNKLGKSGNLDDRILNEVALGIRSHNYSFQNDTIEKISPEFRRNLRILIKHQLPQEANTFLIFPLLAIPEENLLNDGLETVASIQERDKTTAVLLLEALPKLRAFGDKYKIVLDYVKRKREREDLRRIGTFKHEDKVSESLKTIQLTDSGTRQGERLVKLAISLDAISELNEVLQLGFSDTGVVPDLKTSYENVQNTLKGISQKLGIANLDEAYKFLPWLKTKDETAMKALRGKEVTKIGEARSYNLQASSKFDLERMKKEIESYAQAIGIGLSEVPVGDLNLELLKQMAGYVVAKLSKKKDVSEEVLREIKPNLDRIRTAMDKGGNYTISINPQDIKSQLEALQNVGSCLSPGGSMFRYTKEYLKNPNISWATIKGPSGIVGRVTMFRGTDEDGNPTITRVSRVYSQVPIDENEVDKILRNYAVETNASFVERGKLTVPGLQDFYDDFIGTGKGPVVAINR